MCFIKIKRFSKKHISIFLASYTLIFLIPFIISFFTYLQAQRALEAEVSRANNATLELTRSYLDSQLMQVRQLHASIMFNSRINHFMSFQQLGGNEHFLLHQVVRDMSAMRNRYPFISYFYIYFRSSGVVATPSASYSSEMFFNYIHEDNPNHIAQVISLPFVSQEYARAVLVVMLDARNISSSLDNLQWLEGGVIYIVDEHNNLIASSTSTLLTDLLPDFKGSGAPWEIMRINGEEILVSSTLSEEQNWRYIAMLPTRVFSYQIQYIRNFFMSMLVLSLAVGIVMIIILTYRSYAPVHSIVERLPDLTIFEEQKPIVKSHLLHGLLGGSLAFSPGLVENLQVYDVKFPHNYFVVLTMIPVQKEPSDENIPGDLLFYLQNSKKFADMCLYICNVAPAARFVMLCNIPRRPEENFEKFEDLLAEIQAFFALRQDHYIGVGSVYDGSGISSSYSESVIALDSISDTSDSSYVRRYLSVTDAIHFHYPLHTEQKLLDSLKSGDYEQSVSILEDIIAENLQKRKLPMNKKRALFLDIFNTVNKAFVELKVTCPKLTDSRGIENCDTLDEAKEILIICFSDICHHVNIRKKSRNITLLNDVLAYLNSNYADFQCSLSSTAEAVNISVPYLSRFFKEQLGINFNSYLNQLRIDQAKSLLLNSKSDVPVSVIASAVGFNSDTSFNRVFKKYTGKTPGSFRREEKDAKRASK